MTAGDLSVYGEWLVQEANGCTCQGSDAHYGHQSGCGYEPLLKVEDVKDALKTGGYAVIELPIAEDAEGNYGLYVSRAPHFGLSVGEEHDQGSRFRSVEETRRYAAALLAVAAAAEAVEAVTDE